MINSMASISCTALRLLIFAWLASTAVAFTVPISPRTTQSWRLLSSQQTPLVSPAMRVEVMEDPERSSVFRKRVRSPRVSLFRFFRSLGRFLGGQNRKKLAALVFAASVWLRGPVLHQELAAAHAAPVEQVQSELQVESEQSTCSLEEPLEDVTSLEQSRGVGSNKKTKTAIAGAAIVVPTAGVFVVRGRKRASTKSTEEGDLPITGTATTAAASTTMEETPSEEEKTSLVQNVLDTTKKSRLKVDADSYLESLQREKGAITSAISKLTKQVQSSTSEEKSSEAGTSK